MLHDEDDPLSGSFFDAPSTTSAFFDSPNVTRSPLTTSFYASQYEEDPWSSVGGFEPMSNSTPAVSSIPEQSSSHFAHDHSNRFERPEISDSNRADRPIITVMNVFSGYFFPFFCSHDEKGSEQLIRRGSRL